MFLRFDTVGIAGVSKWAGTFTHLRSCIVPAEITEPPIYLENGGFVCVRLIAIVKVID